MKKCPLCKMIVDAKYECPICYTTITYEPEFYSNTEKYVYNKYFLGYLIRQNWFSMLCLIFVIFRIFSVQTHSILFCIISVLAAVFSLIVSIFQRQIAKYIQWKYSEDYSQYEVLKEKVVSGIVAVVFSLLIPYV